MLLRFFHAGHLPANPNPDPEPYLNADDIETYLNAHLGSYHQPYPRGRVLFAHTEPESEPHAVAEGFVWAHPHGAIASVRTNATGGL